uniref:Parkerin n=1 Tax=Nanorana parkeri TaxID=125878 RepID=D0ES75_9NEOB|nr:parkerin [Nanorana parkeri]
MFTLKKSLFLVFFLGMVSLSLCRPESSAHAESSNDPTEEENAAGNEESVEKRGWANTLKNVAGGLCKITGAA